jgi:ABC-type branched-subunit amino acid transport system permease subunit
MPTRCSRRLSGPAQPHKQTQLYLFLMGFAVLAIVGTSNLVRSRIGRAFIAVRDHPFCAVCSLVGHKTEHISR